MNISHRNDVLQFLLSSIKPVACCVITMVVVVAAWAYVTAPRYTARTQLLLDEQLGLLPRNGPKDLVPRVDVPQVESQIVVLRSEKIARIVIAKMQLLHDPDFSGPLPTPADLATNHSDDVRLRRTIDAYLAAVEVQRLSATYVIEIAATASTPNRAAQLSNATAEAYLDDLLQSKVLTARRGDQWLEQRVADLRSQMNAAALRVQEFKAKRDYRIPSKASGRGGATEVRDSDPGDTLEEFEATAQTLRTAYETYLRLHTESVDRQSFPGTNARVISHTAPAKTHPKVAKFLLLATAGGILLGIAISAVQQELANVRIDS
jgi:polysaccharide biosynthesis transport protein